MHHPKFGSNEGKSYFIRHLFIIFCGHPLKSFIYVSYLNPFNISTSVDPHYPSLRYLFLSHSICAALFSSVSPYYLLTSWPLRPILPLLSCLCVSGTMKRGEKAVCKASHVFNEMLHRCVVSLC